MQEEVTVIKLTPKGARAGLQMFEMFLGFLEEQGALPQTDLKELSVEIPDLDSRVKQSIENMIMVLCHSGVTTVGQATELCKERIILMKELSHED